MLALLVPGVQMGAGGVPGGDGAPTLPTTGAGK